MAITLTLINNTITNLNKLTNNPLTPYSDTNKPNINNYHLDESIGGYNLVQMMENGGTRTILVGNSKQDLYRQLRAFINGYTLATTNDS